MGRISFGALHPTRPPPDNHSHGVRAQVHVVGVVCIVAVANTATVTIAHEVTAIVDNITIADFHTTCVSINDTTTLVTSGIDAGGVVFVR